MSTIQTTKWMLHGFRSISKFKAQEKMCKVVLHCCVPLAMYISQYKINSDSQASDSVSRSRILLLGTVYFFRFCPKANRICLMLSSLGTHSIRTYFQITNNDLYVENIKKPYQQLYLVLFSHIIHSILWCRDIHTLLISDFKNHIFHM